MSCVSCGKREDRCRCDRWCELCGGDTNHTTQQHVEAARIMCHGCHDVAVPDEDMLCAECLSQAASHYTPDERNSV